MKIDKEQEEAIVNMAVFGYPLAKMASILGVPLADLEAETKKKDGHINKLIQKGNDMADYVIDLKLFEMAKSGDLKALEKFEYRKESR
jgi:hypothetical protein